MPYFTATKARWNSPSTTWPTCTDQNAFTASSATQTSSLWLASSPSKSESRTTIDSVETNTFKIVSSWTNLFSILSIVDRIVLRLPRLMFSGIIFRRDILIIHRHLTFLGLNIVRFTDTTVNLYIFAIILSF